MARWISDKNAVPPLHYNLIAGRKAVALVRRVTPRKTKAGYRYSYQSVTRFVDIVGGAVGPIFPTLAAAKRHAEAKVSA
jgi:hypothetical protein